MSENTCRIFSPQQQSVLDFQPVLFFFRLMIPTTHDKKKQYDIVKCGSK